MEKSLGLHGTAHRLASSVKTSELHTHHVAANKFGVLSAYAPSLDDLT